MDKDSRFVSLQNFANLLDNYREMIIQKESIISLSESPGDYSAMIANLLDKAIESHRAVLMALYESALL